MALIAIGGLAVTALIRGMFHLDLPGRSFTGAPPPLDTPQLEVASRLRRHVRVLAEDIGERHLWRAGSLPRAAAYVEACLGACGLAVASQEYRAAGVVVRNLEAGIPGRSGAEGIVLVGAHYDTVPGTPGADDNASGVAMLLELPSLLAGARPGRNVRLVAFVNEEPPFHRTDLMGSRVYSRRCRRRGEPIEAMFCLESVGFFSGAPGSQHYPLPLGGTHPDTGNFVALVGNLASRELVRRSIGLFRQAAAIPSEGAALPGWITGVGWSDQWSFWEEGYQALMVTDTALFRYPHYHAAGDTPERLDYDAMARVVTGLAAVVMGLSSP